MEETKGLREEKKYKTVITASESRVIEVIRNMGDFGHVVVFKQQGRILRIEPTGSEIINPLSGEKAAIELGGEQVI